MPSHPVKPDEFPPDEEPGVPNPSHLPIEPEFGIALPVAEPEVLGTPAPVI